MKKMQKKQNSGSVPTTREKNTIHMIEKNFKALEKTIDGLQQELQETLTYMELRLENLEMVVSEIQSELNKQIKPRDANVRSYLH